MRRGHSTFIAFAATLAACQSVPQIYYGTPRPRHPPDELWINNSGEPEYIDPGKSSDSLGSEVIANLFAGLAEVHPQSLTPVPEIATHWDISADGRVYTFHLRESAWSDGQPLTAEDFAFSWRRVLDPNTASRYGSMLHVLKNGQPFNQRALFVAGEHDPDTVARAFTPHIPVARAVRSEAPPGVFVYLGGKDADKSKHLRAALGLTRLSVAGQPLTPRLAGPELVGVRALDARTLQVELEHPLPYFLSLVAYTTFKPVPRHVLDRLAAAHQEVDLWTRPEHIVSNGPYVLTSWHFKHYFTYERNPRYWDAQAVRIRKVKVYEVESANTALNLYRDGDLDWLGSNTPLPSEFLAHLEGFKDCHRDPMLSVYFYWLNTRQAPLDNVKVRRALSLAVDREALVKYVTRGGQLPSADLVPDGLAGYAGLKRPVFDPNAARTLLAEAGFPGGQGLKPITLIYNTSEGHKQIAEAVQGMWHKHLGVDVQIENQEWKVFLQNAELRNFQMARMGWVGDYPDPNTFLHDVLGAQSGNNLSGWSDAAYEDLLERANATGDVPARLALLRQAEALAMDAQPMIPLYVYTRSYLKKPYLRGFWGNHLDRHPLKHMWIDERFYQSTPTSELVDPPPPVGRKS